MESANGSICENRRIISGRFHAMLCSPVPFILIITAFAVGLIFRARYSFCQSDESFYMALVHRLWMGGSLIVDEWHPAQFYSPILLPWYMAYRAIVPSGTGVLFAARVSCILISYCAALFTFDTTRRFYPSWVACFASVLYLVYARQNILGFSYYSLFSAFALLSMMLLIRGRQCGGGSLCYGMAGFFSALVVLCMPISAPLIILTGIFLWFQGRAFSRSVRWSRRCYALAIVVAAILYVIFFIPKIPLQTLSQNLSYMINDPEHTASIAETIRRTLSDFRKLFRNEILLTCAGCIVSLGMGLLFRRRLLSERAFDIVILGSTVLFMASGIYFSLQSGVSIDAYLYVILSLLALPLFLLSFIKERTLQASDVIYLGGGILAVLFVCGSNTRVSCLGTGCCIASIGVLLRCSELLKGIRAYKARKLLSGLFACFCACSVFLAFYARMNTVYRDNDLQELRTEIHTGPAAGLFTTSEHSAEYQQICNLLDELYVSNPDATVFFSKLLPWAYYYRDFHCYAPTAWRTPLSSEHLMAYIQMRNGALPQLVVVFHDEIGSFYGSSSTYRMPNENDFTVGLVPLLLENGYLHRSSACAEIYTAPAFAAGATGSLPFY